MDFLESLKQIVAEKGDNNLEVCHGFSKWVYDVARNGLVERIRTLTTLTPAPITDISAALNFYFELEEKYFLAARLEDKILRKSVSYRL